MRLSKVLIASAWLVGGIFLVMFVAGIVAGYFGAQGSLNLDQAVIWIMGAMAVVLMAGSLWIGALWMRSIDEAAREAHKAAWYWGGSGGMALGGVFVILASLPQAADWIIGPVGDRTDPAAYMAAGAFGMLILMLAGYGLVWGWWWLSRSRG